MRRRQPSSSAPATLTANVAHGQPPRSAAAPRRRPLARASRARRRRRSPRARGRRARDRMGASAHGTRILAHGAPFGTSVRFEGRAQRAEREAVERSGGADRSQVVPARRGRGRGRRGPAALAGRTGGGARARGARTAPNVLVLVLDSLRHDYVGAYGNPWIKTPNIDALARESLRFTRAFPEAMPTVPARRSLMMGRRVYPVARLAPDAQPARLARLDRLGRGHDDVAEDAAPARLLDGLRHRQPVPRLRAGVGGLPAHGRPLRARSAGRSACCTPPPASPSARCCGGCRGGCARSAT